MTASEELMADQARQSSARFFLRAGREGRDVENPTLPLFPLPLIMDCEGLLSREAGYLVGRAG